MNVNYAKPLTLARAARHLQVNSIYDSMPTTTMPGVAASCARMALRPRISLVASSTRTFHSPLALLAPNRASPVRNQLSCFSSTSSFRDTTTPAQKPGITWDEFLLLRRRRRYVNLFASVGTAVGAVAATVPVAMSYELEDKIASETGLDPFIAFGLMITAVGGFGWLMGPFVGNAGFLLANRRIRADIASVSSSSRRSSWNRC